MIEFQPPTPLPLLELFSYQWTSCSQHWIAGCLQTNNLINGLALPQALLLMNSSKYWRRLVTMHFTVVKDCIPRAEDVLPLSVLPAVFTVTWFALPANHSSLWAAIQLPYSFRGLLPTVPCRKTWRTWEGCSMKAKDSVERETTPLHMHKSNMD